MDAVHKIATACLPKPDLKSINICVGELHKVSLLHEESCWWLLKNRDSFFLPGNKVRDIIQSQVVNPKQIHKAALRTEQDAFVNTGMYMCAWLYVSLSVCVWTCEHACRCIYKYNNNNYRIKSHEFYRKSENWREDRMVVNKCKYNAYIYIYI